MNGPSANYDEVLAQIEALSPDIAVLLEVNGSWAQRLQALEVVYPYHLEEARDGFFGIALYSRLPLTETELHDFSGYELPSVEARFLLGETPVALIGTHPPPPANPMAFRIRNWYLEELANEVSGRTEPMIVVGDLNVTPWSAAGWSLLKRADLYRSGVSRAFTWSPIRAPFPSLPLDYQLATRDWRVIGQKTGPFGASDHRWTYTELGLQAATRR